MTQEWPGQPVQQAEQWPGQPAPLSPAAAAPVAQARTAPAAPIAPIIAPALEAEPESARDPNDLRGFENPNSPFLPQAAPAAPTAGTSRDNAIDLRTMTPDLAVQLKRGTWVRHGDEIWSLPGDAYQGEGSGNTDRVRDGVYVDRPSIGRAGEAALTAFSEQIPGADEAAAFLSAKLRGVSFEDVRRQQMLTRGLLNQTDGLARDVGGVAGALAPALLPVGGVLQGVSGLAKTARVATAGAAGGAALGFGNTDGNLRDRLIGAGVNSVVGGLSGGLFQHLAGGFAARAASRAAQPTRQRLLSSAEIRLTPGQMQGGWLQRVEDGATSIPVIGDTIKAAQRRGLEDFNRAAYDDALGEIGRTLPANVDVGRAAFREADQIVSNAYDNALTGVSVTADAPYQQAIAAVRQPRGLTPDMRRNLGAVLDNILEPLNNGTVTADTWKAADSQIAAAVRAADRASESAPEQAFLRDRLSQARDALYDLLDRTDPFAAADVRAADAARAKLYRIQDATTAQGAAARDGIFTAADLSRAVKKGSTNSRRYARGESLLQDLSDAASGVLPATVPDSGTTFRALLPALTALGTGTTATYVGVPFAGLGTMIAGGTGAATMAAYSRPAVGALNRLYRNGSAGGGSRAVAGLLSRAAPRAPALEGGVLQYLLNRPHDDPALLPAR